MTPEQFASFTSRQKFAHNTGQGVCNSCHQSINPFGYAFSKFNGLAFHKETEPAFRMDLTFTGAQLPLDSTTNMAGVVSGGGAISDATEFSNFVASRSETKACFTKNYAEYFLGENIDTNTMGCRLNKFYKFLEGSGTLKDAMRSMAADTEFRYKKLQN
jgi:hypothetical protein